MDLLLTGTVTLETRASNRLAEHIGLLESSRTRFYGGMKMRK